MPKSWVKLEGAASTGLRINNDLSIVGSVRATFLSTPTVFSTSFMPGFMGVFSTAPSSIFTSVKSVLSTQTTGLITATTFYLNKFITITA